MPHSAASQASLVITPIPRVAIPSRMGAHHTGDKNPSSALFREQDNAFVALVDGAFADAASRSGPHLLCRPGCTQCCIGVFAIGPADALRLRQGLSALQQEDPERAARIQERAAASWHALPRNFLAM